MQVYLTIPLCLPGLPDDNTEDKVVNGKILPASILAYHPGRIDGTFLYLSTGQAFLTPLTVEEYEKRIQQYWNELGKAAVRKIKTFH